MRDLLIGLDVGTSSLKALLCDASGRVLATSHAEYPLATPHPGWSEQDPDLWVRAAHQAIPQLLTQAGVSGLRVAAIGMDGQMHGAVLLDRHGAPVRPAILWNDSRSAPECDELTAQMGADQILARTGNRLLPGFTAPKISWVQRHELDNWARTAQILLPKDYVRYKLGGAYATDVSDASGTLYFDVQHRTWSQDMLRDLRIAEALVPQAHESAQVVDKLNATAARVTGLTEGTPLIAGAGDQAAGAVGTGIVDPGRLSCVLGTSGVIFAASDTYRSSPGGALHAFCHAAPERWHVMSVMLAAAGSFRWFAQTLAHQPTPASDWAERLDALAQTAPAGCDGLVFLPTLAGERCPYPDPRTTGSFANMNLSHEPQHFARAVMEGVTASMALCLELIRSADVPVQELAISGGGFNSPFWTQCCADAFGAPLVRMTSSDGAALGSALLASVGAGLHRTVQEAVATVQVTARTQPDPSRHAFWHALATRQQALHAALAAWQRANPGSEA